MLISKTLQNLASGVSFKTNMELMNSFMENNTAALDQFFSQITVVPPEYVYTPTYTLDEVNKHDLPFIHKSILQKLDPIAKNLMTHNQQEAISQMVAVLAQIGEDGLDLSDLQKEWSDKKVKKKQKLVKHLIL